MGRVHIPALRIVLALTVMISGPAAWAESSVDAVSSVVVVAPGGTTANPATVTGSVVLPLSMSIGASGEAFGGGLPPASFGSGLRLRIGTESTSRDIARVLSRTNVQQASFTIVGERDQIVSIGVPSLVWLAGLNGEGEVEFVPVANVGKDGTGTERLVASADGTGMLAFDVGGGLMPKALAPPGAYVGVLKVTVQYN